MLNLGESSVPPAVQGDQHEHQALGVEGGPAEEERNHNNN